MASSKRPSVGFLATWHCLVVVLLLLSPRLKFDVPFWHLSAAQLRPLLILLGGYVVCALAPLMSGLRHRPVTLSGLLMTTLAVFGVIFFYMLVKKDDSSRIIMVFVLLAAVLLIPLSLRIQRFQMAGVSLLGIAVVVLLVVNLRPSANLKRRGVARTDTSLIKTGFYNLRAVLYQDYIPEPAVAGGGLSKIGDRLLLATGDGYLYLLNWSGDQEALKVQPLPYRVPANGDEFSMDLTGKPWHQPLLGETVLHAKEDAGNTIISWWFRVSGVLVQELDDRVRVFASHYYWKRKESCWVERVSMLEGDREAFLKGADGFAWRTLFESKPCLPVKGEGRRRGTAFAGHFGGGRMAMRDPDTLLLTVGDFGFNGIASKQLFSQDPTASYGKTIQIHLGSGLSEIYTMGNRNPQGLYIDPKGTIWDTEHGPQGGDELNLIKQGANYGWPIVTYGTDYGTFAWPLNPKQGEHEGFEAPFYAWMPSIGVSNLIGVEKDLFPIWRGDLLVSSLNGSTVYRLRIRDNRVAYSEPIVINKKRIRDIAEGQDGRIVLWEDDDNTIVSLRPMTGSNGEALFATDCSGCHKVGDGTSHRIGPDLWGISGRAVASADGFIGYSPALRALGGKWTDERLSRFIENPQAMVPGSAMEIDGISDAGARAKIIDYLKHAEKVELE
jgi:cytochrome c2